MPSQLPWAQTHDDALPEVSSWGHVPHGADRAGFDAETWAARLIDLLETRVIDRLDELSRRVAELEADRDPRQ